MKAWMPVVRKDLGLRTVELRDWQVYLNGRRIFVRGANYAPADARLAQASAADYEKDVRLAVDANMNMLRVHAHIEKPEFYQNCARQGLLLWQDFPLQWGYDHSILPEAERQIRGRVRLLGSETAVGIWCCHNEPFALAKTETPGQAEFLRNVAGSLSSNWFKRVMDPVLAAAVADEDPSRSVIPFSGDFGFLHGGQDAHHYWGWYQGQMRDLERVLTTFPKTARFVSEYGAQAFPVAESCEAFVQGNWPAINWDELKERCMLQPDVMSRFVDPVAYDSLAAYIAATQEYQRTFLKYYSEQLRRRKYRPTGGLLLFMLADASPGVSWSIVDYWRRPKPAYDQVRRDFSPVHLIADWPAAAYKPGETLRTRITFINDRPHPVEGRRTWHVRQQDAVLAADTHAVQLPADSVVDGPRIRWTIPAEVAQSPLTLALRLESRGEVLATNEYHLPIARPSAAPAGHSRERV
ncbi:MAG: glycoside hydrolase family 2 TIM barrel-domain containing protein [Symbiobacteriia bacterium]